LSEPTPPPVPIKKPLGVLRGLAAVLGILIMVLTGGCALIITVAGGANANDIETVLMYVAPPFLVGLLIFLAATRLGRR
jgi:hypothetical protein